MRDRRLDDLSDRFRPVAFEALARLNEAGVQVMLVETLRTHEQHLQDLANGVSWAPVSKHESGDAIDVCPWMEWVAAGPKKLNWDANSPWWARIGEVFQRVPNSTWGGTWKHHPDLGHLELSG